MIKPNIKKTAIYQICGVNLVGNMNGIMLYEDLYMEDNRILQGHKQGLEKTFMIANPKTANIIYKLLLRKERKEKLNKINGK